jgi:hypothetical protein
MGAKTKVQRERLSMFDEDDQQTNQDKETVPEEVLLNSSHPEARQLFDLAVQTKELQPWRWMEETDVIGIEHPETGEIGFISVMGAIGEYEAVALYLGAEGLYGFIDLQQDSNPDWVIELAHLQVAFSERKYLEREDLKLIKELSLKFKAAGAWPMFRSFRVGYLPWLITVNEARFLMHALSQAIHVARRVRDEAQPFHPIGRNDQGGYLMRVSSKGPSGLIWEDQVWRIPPLTSEPIRVIVDAAMLESLKQVPRSKFEFEIDLTLAPARIGPPGQRPVAAYMLMIADRDSGFIFGFELMSAQDSLAAMDSRIPNTVAKLLSQAQIVPARMTVRSDKLRTVLESLAQRLNIELRYADKLPSIDEAMESMTAWMRTGKV